MKQSKMRTCPECGCVSCGCEIIMTIKEEKELSDSVCMDQVLSEQFMQSGWPELPEKQRYSVCVFNPG